MKCKQGKEEWNNDKIKGRKKTMNRRNGTPPQYGERDGKKKRMNLEQGKKWNDDGIPLFLSVRKM